jgi:hypothetical protein
MAHPIHASDVILKTYELRIAAGVGEQCGYVEVAGGEWEG